MSRFIYGIIFISGILFQPGFISVYSQAKNKTDSLINLLASVKEDTGKVKLFRALCTAFRQTDSEKAIDYGEKGILLSEKLNYPKGKAECLHEIGVACYYQGKYDKSLEYYLKALKILEGKNEMEEAGLKNLIGDNHHDIGKVYYRQKQFDKALESYERALAIYRQFGNKSGIATCLNNIGGVYDARKDFDKTLYYLKESLKITEEIGDKSGIATRVNNIGLQYQVQGKYNEALKYLHRAMKIREEINDTKGLAYSYNDIGGLYSEIKNYETALFYLNKGLEFSKIANAKERIIASLSTLSTTYSSMKKYDSAYEYQLQLTGLKDSIFSEQSGRQIAEMSAKYESDKKQKEIELLQKDKELQASELAKSELQKFGFIGGFILVLAFAIAIFRSYRNKKKANLVITAQKNKVEIQKKIIEEKNKDITDSIQYASYIQQAILPEENEFTGQFPDSFVLFKPRDMVSGDFFWISKKNQNSFLLTADCTGHGVPGAFMSMIGNALYNEAVNEKNIFQPDLIFDEVRKGLINSLKQKGKEGGQKDGMDAVLCRFINSENKIQLECACANNPVIIIKSGAGKNRETIEIPPNRFPVGTFGDENRPFTLHSFELSQGDIVYSFTDGFSDQFGGTKGKKFKYSQFKNLLISISDKAMEEQKRILNETIENWRGKLDQIDDICVIGVRV